MNVAILHSHFCRGGVTQVVENHVAAIADQLGGKVVLVSGGRNDGLTAATFDKTATCVVPGLDYDAVLGIEQETREGFLQRVRALTNALIEALAHAGLDGDNTVLHWHNHSLGKNVAVPRVIDALATEHGFRQLLQIHDFAEDFRPENYLRLARAAMHHANESAAVSAAVINRFLYPRSPFIDYATLTSGDAKLLSQLGIPERQLHVLPNSVALSGFPDLDQAEALKKVHRAAGLPTESRWCVYPVRGIRRKNVGELLLLSHLMPEDLYAGITLPPTTKLERQSYDRWKSIGEEVAPKVVFDAGTFAEVSFHDNLSAAEFVVSTSAAEGFGMAFLEPWLVPRGVIARRLPDVVCDFEAAGVLLDRFYDAVWIPGDAAWVAECLRDSAAAFQSAWSLVSASLGPELTPREMRQRTREDAIDFATLTTRRQIDVLRRARTDPSFFAAVRQCNQALVNDLAEGFPGSLLGDNQRVVRDQYALSLNGDRQRSIYRKLQDRKGLTLESEEVNVASESLADQIAKRRMFYPCRTETEIVG